MAILRSTLVSALILTSSLQPPVIVLAQQQAAAATQIPPTGGATARVGTTRLLPAPRPDVLGTIQGNALSSTNGQLPNSIVRLRDARFGRIVDSQLTDQAGLFTFKALDPGSYIVELLANDHTMLAAGQVLNVNAGEAVSAVVKLPFRIPPYAGVLGTSSTPASAVSVVTEAATSGVLSVTTAGDPTCPQ